MRGLAWTCVLLTVLALDEIAQLEAFAGRTPATPQACAIACSDVVP